MIVLVSALTFSGAVRCDFVNWDDGPNLTANPNLRPPINWRAVQAIVDPRTGTVLGNYNPLPILSFALEQKVFGRLSSSVVHADNVLLHLTTTALVFGLLLEMGLPLSGAVLATLLFGLHPMRVESVAWATERKDVLFAVFYFSALRSYVRSHQAGGKRTGLITGWPLVCTILACLSKVQAVMAPVSMVLLDFWFQRPITLRSLRRMVFLWLAALATGLTNLVTLHAHGSLALDTDHYTLTERIALGRHTLLVYVSKLAVPHPLSPFYSYPPMVPLRIMVAPLFCAVVGTGLWLLARVPDQDKARGLMSSPVTISWPRPVWFGLLFFVTNVGPVLQIVSAGHGYLADRFTYVPFFGLFVIVGWFFAHTRSETQHKLVWDGAAALSIVLLASISVNQVGIWRNSDTLWTRALTVNGETSSLPYWNRARYQRDHGRYDLAMADYNAAIAIDPANADLYNSRGKTSFELANKPSGPTKRIRWLQQAIDDFNTGLRCPGKNEKLTGQLLINRGAARAAAGESDAALADFSAGLQIDPDNIDGYYNRARVLIPKHRFDEAVSDYSRYLVAEPRDAMVWYKVGLLRRAISQPRQAVDAFSQALALDPDLKLAYLERARAWCDAGDSRSALQDYQRAAELGLPLEPSDLARLRQ